MPIWRWFGGRAEISLPSTRIEPRVGRSKPAIILNMVVLPQPEGPSRVMNSPLLKARLASLTTGMPPNSLTRSARRRNSGRRGAASGMGSTRRGFGGETGEQLDHAHRDPGENERDDGERR